jgi:hypothetical protein
LSDISDYRHLSGYQLGFHTTIHHLSFNMKSAQANFFVPHPLDEGVDLISPPKTPTGELDEGYERRLSECTLVDEDENTALESLSK